MTPRPSARFELVTHHGQAVSHADFRDGFLLVYFGFTHCRVVCPRMLAALSSALEMLGTAGDAITALYVTTDPERDTPDVMRAYLSAPHPRFTGLTGTQDQVDSAKRAFRVFAERRDDPLDPDGYSVPHTGIAYFMAPDGSYITHFMDGTEPTQISTRLAAELAAAGRPA